MTAIGGRMRFQLWPAGTQTRLPPVLIVIQSLYNQIIDAWSMRNWERGPNPATIISSPVFTNSILPLKITWAKRPRAPWNAPLQTTCNTSNSCTPSEGCSRAELGAKLGFEPDFAAMREKFLSAGLKDAVAAAREELNKENAAARKMLGCSDGVDP